VHVLLCRELFVKVESAMHLEDMFPAVVLHFSGFIEGYKSAVGAQCWSSVEGRSVD
jgi:hypothetical protein